MLSALQTLADFHEFDTTTFDSGSGAEAAGFFALTGIFLLFVLVVAVIIIAGMWKVFEKAKKVTPRIMPMTQ